MREILFRGKRSDNGEWVEGIPINTHIGTFIVFEENPHFCDQYGYMEIDGLAKVCPSTVGQYTGLSDKNGKRIFEGDVVRDNAGALIPVVWGNAGFHLRYAQPYAHGHYYDLIPLGNYWHAHGAIIEIVGNIHDNPELLEV